jgi:hypothetical protein
MHAEKLWQGTCSRHSSFFFVLPFIGVAIVLNARFSRVLLFVEVNGKCQNSPDADNGVLHIFLSLWGAPFAEVVFDDVDVGTGHL